LEGGGGTKKQGPVERWHKSVPRHTSKEKKRSGANWNIEGTKTVPGREGIPVIIEISKKEKKDGRDTNRSECAKRERIGKIKSGPPALFSKERRNVPHCA